MTSRFKPVLGINTVKLTENAMLVFISIFIYSWASGREKIYYWGEDAKLSEIFLTLCSM